MLPVPSRRVGALEKSREKGWLVMVPAGATGLATSREVEARELAGTAE